MRIDKLFYLALPVLFVIACNTSINNVWVVPNTELKVWVDKRKPSSLRDEVERQMSLRDETFADKAKIKLVTGINNYSRINVYQISENQYLLRDVFEIYSLDTQAKTLVKTSPGILSQTFESTEYPKFIGAFDDNENGGWRYIPASERAEIPLTTVGGN